MNAARVHRLLRRSLRSVVIVVVLALLPAGVVRAHCDTMDGPVVQAARRALEAGSLDHVLYWVRADDEAAVREAFEKTLGVRALGEEARDLADRWFFETVVRLHRAGEGEPFTGLKPAGTDPGPAVTMADEAIALGSATRLLHSFNEELRRGVRERYDAVMAARGFPLDDTEAGREYAAAYVRFVHYVRGLHATIEGSSASNAHGASTHQPAPHGPAHDRGHRAHASGAEGGGLAIPEPLEIEHRQLHATLKRASEESGRTGEAARRVVEVLRPHFQRENEIALPALSLLVPLSKGRAPEHPEEVLRLTDALERELPRMLEEHEAIVGALEGLRSAAEGEGKREYAAFADSLILHAQTEELVLYPAAILVGERVRDAMSE